jgi:GT2 family glycosyltransferase
LAAEKAIQEALVRRGRPARIERAPGYDGQFLVQWELQGTPLISIVILTRDQAPILAQCLTSIFEKTTYQKFEIILIDNGSVESETLELLTYWTEREPARFRFERHDIPFNFHTLNNLGAKTAQGDILLFLNNDTEVINPDWLYKMAAQAQRPEIGVVGCKLLYPNGTIQHAGIMLGINGWAGHSHKHKPGDNSGYEGRLLGPSNYSAVTGACLMLERNLFWKLGGMNEQLQIACGDVELCLRVLVAGYYNVVLPDVAFIHHESLSRGHEDNEQKKERFRKEKSYVLMKYPQFFEKDPFYNPNLSKKREDFSIGL